VNKPPHTHDYGETCDEGTFKDDVGCTTTCTVIDPLYECLTVGQACTLKCGNENYNTEAGANEVCDYNSASPLVYDRSEVMYITDKHKACCASC